MSRSAEKPPLDRKTVLLGTLAIFALAFAARSANLSHEPITDELYHLLAADSWAEEGTFAIADGEYRRARVFTVLVGIVDRLTGGSVDAVRILCIVFGSALVAAVFYWVSRHVGLAEGITAAAFLAFLPTAIFLSQYIRFYGLHALAFFLIAGCTWTIINSSYRRAVVAAACALPPLIGLGIHLQVTTLVGLAGLMLWVLLVRYRAILDRLPGRGLRIMIAAALIVVLAAVGLLGRDVLVQLIQSYGDSALWNSNDDMFYYYVEYRDTLGFLWALAPAAFIVAFLTRPSVALFCTCIFGVAFIAQSFGGMRSERFMFYALPFLFIVWGLAAVAMARVLATSLGASLPNIPIKPLSQRTASFVSALVVAGVFAFALVTVPAFETSVKMMLGIPTSPPEYWDRYQTHWATVAPELRELAAERQVVVASQPLHAIYYLGDVDYAMNATTLADVAPRGAHRALDPRTGRIVFDDLATLQSVLRCHASGIIVVHGPAMQKSSRVSGRIAEFLESTLQEFQLAHTSDLRVFEWATDRPRSDCESWSVPGRVTD